MSEPPATILIPTRRRPAYLEVALASVLPQAARAGAEVLVVDDGPDAATASVCARHRVPRLPTRGGAGANAARNLGIAAGHAPLVVLIDDDVRAPDGWLEAILRGAAAYPDHAVLGGPIRAALERAPRSCGREGRPITTLDRGPRDRDVDRVWSANMAIRRTALERVGPFDETIRGRGEEEEWEERCAAAGGRIRYLAAAGLDHRRTAADATVPALARSAFALGRTARRFDVRGARAPSLTAEAATLLGCVGHVVRRRCPNMIPGAAHAAGRLRELVAERAR